MRMKDKLIANVKAVKPVDKSFEAFKKRFHNIMGDKLDITDEQLGQIYDGVLPYIETSIYAEMEDVLSAIRNTYRAVVGWMTEDLEKYADTEAYESKGDLIRNNDIQEYINHENSFNRFIAHVVTNYQSLPKQRIDILIVKHEGYQRIECQLFNESFIQHNGFRKAYYLHNELMKAFYTTFDDLLCKGTVLKTDQAINEQVLAPVLERFEAKVDTKEGDKYEQAVSLQGTCFSKYRKCLK
ncbi:hypothetical protein [Virgibacillus dakarensis]|uniref:hypothetical protein n=1 Tax=Virgibacillus dakarensis TaxID=1917889 RepID=UPI000B45250D|nr:hypothetical protein [Virgibacillus dakarensis]